MRFQSLTPPDGCDACEQYSCVCDWEADRDDRAFHEWRDER